MAESLSSACTPLKHKYDSCFNSWFEGYLERAVAADESAEDRTAYSIKAKADEFDSKCGQIWAQYKQCLQGAVKQKGLEKLLSQAREEYPLTSPPPPPPPSSSTGPSFRS